MTPFRARVQDDFAPQSRDEFVRAQVAASLRGRKSWGVERSGELGGLIWFERLSPVQGAIHCLFRKEFWGAKTTDTAMRAAWDELFSDGLLKTLSVVFADNLAIQALARRNGARVHKQPLRSHTIRGGQPVDGVLIEMLREDFYGMGRSGINGRERAQRTVRPEEETDNQHRPHVDADLHGGPVGNAVDVVGVPTEPIQESD